jgi:hypothetical protein
MTGHDHKRVPPTVTGFTIPVPEPKDVSAGTEKRFWRTFRERRLDLPLARSEPGRYLLVTGLRRTHSSVVTASPVGKTSGIHGKCARTRKDVIGGSAAGCCAG